MLLIENSKQKEKTKAVSKAQTRQTRSELKKTSGQTKKVQEKHVKQEPVEDTEIGEAATEVAATEIEVLWCFMLNIFREIQNDIRYHLENVHLILL